MLPHKIKFINNTKKRREIQILKSHGFHSANENMLGETDKRNSENFSATFLPK